jgi:hypothetical protein
LGAHGIGVMNLWYSGLGRLGDAETDHESDGAGEIRERAP